MDLSDGATAVRALSLIATVIGLGPLLAPPVGGLIAELLGWRGVLAALAGFGLLTWVLALIAVPESLPRDQRTRGPILGAYASIFTILTKPVFLFSTISFACGFSAMMSYIAASPFVGQSILGMGPVPYSLSFALAASALIIANLINARLAVVRGVATMFTAGSVLLVVAAAAFAAQVGTDSLTIPGFVFTAFILTAGSGLTMSNANAIGLAQASASTRGAGAAVMGATQFLLATVTTPLVGLAGETSAVPMVIVIGVLAACSVAAGIVVRVLLHRR